jgi:hypothetical protein
MKGRSRTIPSALLAKIKSLPHDPLKIERGSN